MNSTRDAEDVRAHLADGCTVEWCDAAGEYIAYFLGNTIDGYGSTAQDARDDLAYRMEEAARARRVSRAALQLKEST